jgi:LemA protein
MIVAVLAGLVLLTGIFLYNSVISKKNEVENALGGLDAQLKQRYDLVPNLVSTVSTYMEHEKSTLEKIVELRSQGLQQNLKTSEKQDVNRELSASLSTILVQAEQYPDLKSSTNFQELQKTLQDIEENIAASRRFYNAAVTEFNNVLEMFPTSIFARMMGLRRKEVFNIPESEKKNHSVKDLFSGKAS